MSETQEEVRVFISWSKARSRAMAVAFKDWLPNVLQRAKPWISDDIEAGAKWAIEIGVRLDSYHIGVCCVTPENQTEPWLLYEAGALSKAGQSRVCPLLFPGVEPTSIAPPLGLLNVKCANEAGVLDLVSTINGLLAPGAALSQVNLAKAVSRWWPDLKEALDAIPSEPEPQPRRLEEKVDEILSLVRGASSARIDGVSDNELRAELVWRRELRRTQMGRREERREDWRHEENDKTLTYWVAVVMADDEEFRVWTSGGQRPSHTRVKFRHPVTRAAVEGNVFIGWNQVARVPEDAISAWELLAPS